MSHEPPESDQAVLTLARRTAEEYIAVAEEHVRTMRAEARLRAEQTRRDARLCAEKIRSAAEEALAEAQAAAVLSNVEAARATVEIRRRAELTLTEALVEAERIVAAGRDQAERLRVRAQQRYEDIVGVLPTKRAALQKQVEALEVFDAHCRQQLTGSIQRQSQLLWADPSEVVDSWDTRSFLPELFSRV